MKKSFLLKIPTELYEKIKAVASERYMSVTAFIISEIVNYIQKEEVKKHIEKKEEEK